MAQTVHITVDGGNGGGALIRLRLDGILFFEATGSAPSNLSYDVSYGEIATNMGMLDVYVAAPATTSDTLQIRLTGALNENVNVPAVGGNTAQGYNDFIRSIPITGGVSPIAPEMSEYFQLNDDNAYFSGNKIIVTGNLASITVIKLPVSGYIDFNVNASEFSYASHYYLAGIGGSNLHRVLSGVPALNGDTNGVYVSPANVANDYTGTITIDDSLGEAFTYPATFSIGAGTWETTFITPPDPENPDDPYNPAGPSGPGGGVTSFSLISDSVDFPSLPTLTAVSTGLVSVYTPSLAQLNALANYMWNANVADIDWWKKLVANPLDLILGLSIVPVAVPSGTTQNVKVGLIDTGISMTKAASQYVEVDCGSIEVKEFYGAALDYLPFRKTSIYLPFIGTRTISTDDIMGKTIHVKYHIDLLSGACTALVKCGDAVLYQYSGACAVSLPLSGETFTNMITSTIQLAASIFATTATGGTAAGITAASAANSVMSMKPAIERAGGVSGAAGQLGIMTPYLIGEIPRQSVPENYNSFAGYPSNIYGQLKEFTGFTSIEIIHMENLTATNAEKSELDSILKAGVIL